MAQLQRGTFVSIQRADLQQLFDALTRRSFHVMGPTVREGAIVYDELRRVEELPIGWTDEQDGGTYRLKRRADQALFGYTVGPHAWKKFLLPSTATLWQAQRTPGGFQPQPQTPEAPMFAFLGVRACELQAIAIQDRVLLDGMCRDPIYAARRKQVFIIALNCTQAGGTCFCASMKTGPKAASGFDLALTEVLKGTRHEFLVEVGTDRGGEILKDVPHAPASRELTQQADALMSQAASQMGRSLDTTGIRELLEGNLEHPRWDEVATRCLACTNCTMACPTCFCTTVEDVTDLKGGQAQRVRRWDSCFTLGFSYAGGVSARSSVKARYRQWLTHKLATWIDQFGTSGCVGCGRCITWCPVGIDLTEEVRAIRAHETSHAAATTTTAQEEHHA